MEMEQTLENVLTFRICDVDPTMQICMETDTRRDGASSGPNAGLLGSTEGTFDVRSPRFTRTPCITFQLVSRSFPEPRVFFLVAEGSHHVPKQHAGIGMC